MSTIHRSLQATPTRRSRRVAAIERQPSLLANFTRYSQISPREPVYIPANAPATDESHRRLMRCMCILHCRHYNCISPHPDALREIVKWTATDILF